MPNKNSTLIAVVLDRSGSMSVVRESTLSGLNEFLESQRRVDGETRLHLVQFDHEYQVTHSFRSLAEVKPLSALDYEPRGTTALLDAIGRTVDEVGAKLSSLAEEDRPGKVLVVIQTDGFENASRDYSRGKVFDMITHQREKYGWEFVFLGANQDAIHAGQSLGVLASNSLTYNSNAVSTQRAFGAVGMTVRSYRVGASANASFDSNVRSYVSEETDDVPAPQATSSSEVSQTDSKP